MEGIQLELGIRTRMKTKVVDNKSKTQKYETSASNLKNVSKELYGNHLEDYTSLKASKYPMIILHDILHTNNSGPLQYSLNVHKIERGRNRNDNLEISVSKELNCSIPEEMKLPLKKRGRPKKKSIKYLVKNESPKYSETPSTENNNKANREKCGLVPDIMNIKAYMKNQIKLRECSVKLIRCTFKRPSDACDDVKLITENSKIKAHSVLSLEGENGTDVNSMIEENNCKADISLTKDVLHSEKDSKPTHECFTKKSNPSKNNKSYCDSVITTAKRKLPQIINNCILSKQTFDASVILQNRSFVDDMHSFEKNIEEKHFGDSKESYTENTNKANSNIETSNYPVIKSPKRINENSKTTQLLCNRSMPLLDETITDNENNNNTENKKNLEHNFLKNENSLKTDSNKVHSSKIENHTCINVEKTKGENIMNEDNQIDNAISDFFSNCMKNRISKTTASTKQDHSNINEIEKISSLQNDVQQSTELTNNVRTKTVHKKNNAIPETNAGINIPTLVKYKEINERDRIYSEEPIGMQSLTTDNLKKFNVIASNSQTNLYAEKYVKSLQETMSVAKDINIDKQHENEQRSTIIASRKRACTHNTDMSSEKADKKKIKLDRNSWKKRKLTESNPNTFPTSLTKTCDTSSLSKSIASTDNENRKPISFRTRTSRTSNTVLIKPTTIENLAAEPKQHSFNTEEQSNRKRILNVSKSPERSMSTKACRYVTKNEDATSKEKITAKDKTETNNDSDNDDCISILCDSDFINDLAKHMEDGFTDLADTHTSSEEYTLTNNTWNNYMEKNKLEAEEDLKIFSVSNTHSDVTFIRDTTVKSTETIKTQPLAANNTVTKDSSKENHVFLPTKKTLSKTNVKSRLGCEVTVKKENDIPVAPHQLFYGHCFQKLQHGLCYRRNCTYNHNLNYQMSHLYEKNYERIHEVIQYAIKHEYRYFIQYIYGDLLKNMNPKQILSFYTLIHNANFLNDNCAQKTIESLIEERNSFEEVVEQLMILFDENGISNLYYRILERAEDKIVFGKWWKTFRQLFIRSIPPVSYVRLIIQECLSAQEEEAFVKDVALNLINKLTIDYSQSSELRDVLPLFFKLHDRITRGLRNSTNNNLRVVQDYSPFSVDTNPLVKILPNLDVESKSATSIKKSERYVSQLLRHVTRETVDTGEPIYDPSRNLSTLESPINSLDSTLPLDIGEGDKGNIPSNESTQIESGTTNNSPHVTDVPWVIHRIDNLHPPNSSHHHRFWKFNIDLSSLQEGIRHRDYEHVLQILDKYSRYENNLFLKGCYHVLRNNIMSSDEHLTNIIKISVQTGMSPNLEETLFTLSRYVLTELADNGSWVLAYKLLKTVQIYESRFNTGFILLSAEIYLANGRPLKALEILRQTNVIFTNRKKWRIHSESRDEDLRVMIVTLLLESLCDNFVESAFALYDTLLGDQYCTYFPIDLPRYIDKLTLGLLTAEKYDLVIELSRLLVPFNLMLRPSILRAVTVTATTRDIKLAKQLFQYGARLGVYQAIKLNTPIFLVVNTSWTEEEMYLAVTELIQQLVMETGHAIDHMSIKQLVIYVSFEIIPSSKELRLNEVRKYDNNVTIRSTRRIMENVLKHRFDPPLGFVKSYRDKIAKLSSVKLLNYIKSTHVTF